MEYLLFAPDLLRNYQLCKQFWNQ